jgi:hypothetical protein
VSGSRALPPIWPPQCSCVVIESSFDPGGRLQAPGGASGFLDLYKVLFDQSLVPMSYWFQTRRLLCEFPIGSYVKLSSAVGAILVERPNTFLEENHPMTFHQNFVLIEQMVSDKILWAFPIGSYVKLRSAVVAILVGGLKCQT